MKRLWDNRAVRGFAILLLIAGIVTAAQLDATLNVVGGLVRIAFFLAIAFFLFLTWRDRRGDLEAWSEWNRRVFYAAIVVAVADIGAVIGLTPNGIDAAVFFVVLGACGYAIYRVWRAEHAYR
jgi:quinol-cytochrome oxidoreductase complex cytochrome b subunit